MNKIIDHDYECTSKSIAAFDNDQVYGNQYVDLLLEDVNRVSLSALSQAAAVIDQSNLELREIYGQLMWSRKEYENVTTTMMEKEYELSESKGFIEQRIKELEVDLEREELLHQLEYMQTFGKLPYTLEKVEIVTSTDYVETSGKLLNETQSTLQLKPLVPIIDLKDFSSKEVNKRVEGISSELRDCFNITTTGDCDSLDINEFRSLNVTDSNGCQDNPDFINLSVSDKSSLDKAIVIDDLHPCFAQTEEENLRGQLKQLQMLQESLIQRISLIQSQSEKTTNFVLPCTFKNSSVDDDKLDDKSIGRFKGLCEAEVTRRVVAVVLEEIISSAEMRAIRTVENIERTVSTPSSSFSYLQSQSQSQTFRQYSSVFSRHIVDSLAYPSISITTQQHANKDLAENSIRIKKIYHGLWSLRKPRSHHPETEKSSKQTKSTKSESITFYAPQSPNLVVINSIEKRILSKDRSYETVTSKEKIESNDWKRLVDNTYCSLVARRIRSSISNQPVNAATTRHHIVKPASALTDADSSYHAKEPEQPRDPKPSRTRPVQSGRRSNISVPVPKDESVTVFPIDVGPSRCHPDKSIRTTRDSHAQVFDEQTVSHATDLHMWRVLNPRRNLLTTPPTTLKYARFKNKYKIRHSKPAGIGNLPSGFRSTILHDSNLGHIYEHILTRPEQKIKETR